MKKLLTRLRPLLPLMAVVLLLTNCSDDYNATTATGAGNPPVSTSRLLTGREAQQQVNTLISQLDKNGKKGSARLLQSMSTGAGGNLRTTLADVRPYIDSTQVLLVTDSVNHKRNYTYRLKHPKANDTLFYNLVRRDYNGYSRVTLITYKMERSYAQNYRAKGDLSSFTGEVELELIYQDAGDPCDDDDENPATGGGGGSAGHSDVYDGVYDPGSGIDHNQYVVAVQFMELQADAEFYDGSDGWINIHHSPRGFLHPGFKMAFNLNGTFNDNGDPCDEDEVGVLDPFYILIPEEFKIEYPCQTDIIEDAYGVCTGLNEIFLAEFNSSDSHNITYNHAPLTNSTSNANTSYDYNSIDANGNTKYYFSITFKDSYLNTATDLSIARTAIHENLHAILMFFIRTEFYYILEDNPTYAQLLEAYCDYLVASGSIPFMPANNNLSHAFMAQFVGDIADTLKAYGVSKGYNLPESYYNAMAWGGLQDTEAFNELYPANTPERIYIDATLIAEQENAASLEDMNGNPILDSSGNLITAQGFACP